MDEWIAAVCREESVRLIPFEGTAEYPFPEGRIIKKFQLTDVLNQVDKVITLAKMKTHTFMGMTGATKILFGCIVNELHGRGQVLSFDHAPGER